MAVDRTFFSEDIDLALNHSFFTEKLENNQQLKLLRKRCRRYVVSELAADLQDQMAALGLKDFSVTAEVVDASGMQVSSEADPSVIYVNYRSVVWHNDQCDVSRG